MEKDKNPWLKEAAGKYLGSQLYTLLNGLQQLFLRRSGRQK